MSPSQIDKLRAHSEHLLDLFIGLREKYVILEPLAFDAALVTTLGAGPANRGFEILRSTLLLSCLQDLAKLTLDRSRRAPSAANLVARLDDEEVRTSLKRDYSIWNLPVDPKENPAVREALSKMEEREQRERGQQFDKHHADLVRLWSELERSEELASCQTIRDKLIAHSDLHHDGEVYRLLDIGSLGMKWGDLRALIGRLQQVVELVNLLTRSSSFAFDMLDEQLALASTSFWALKR